VSSGPEAASRAIFTLKERGVLVTGGGGALGRAIGKTLAGLGADLALCDISGERAHAVADALRAEFPEQHIVPIVVDIRRPQDVQLAFEEAEHLLGQIDVVITSPGEVTATRFELLSFEQWRDTMAVHLDGAFLCISAALPAMRRRRFGRVVCVSSTSATQGAAFMVDYACAKGGLAGLVESLAREVAEDGITVNAVAPGSFWGAGYDALPTERVKLMESSISVGHIADPMEIASILAYLASDEGGFITGQVVSIDGGLDFCSHLAQPPRPRAIAAE
jgi:3-oxoacyl-[acyl-carrier protein] reductase